MTVRATLGVLLAALLIQGCVYGWRPVNAAAPDRGWASAIERPGPLSTSYDVERRTRILRTRGAETEMLVVVEPGQRIRVAGASLVLGSPEITILPRADLQLEVEYVDAGLTALSSILWSLAATATVWGVGFMVVMVSILGGDCRCAPAE